MAVLSRSVTLTDEWTNVTAAAALNLEVGSRYIVEVTKARSRAVVLAVDTDDANVGPPADDENAHRLFPHSHTRGADPRVHEPQTGAFSWMRTTDGEAVVVATKVA